MSYQSWDCHFTLKRHLRILVLNSCDGQYSLSTWQDLEWSREHILMYDLRRKTPPEWDLKLNKRGEGEVSGAPASLSFSLSVSWLWMLPLALAAYLCHDGLHPFKLCTQTNFPHFRLLFVRYFTQQQVTKTASTVSEQYWWLVFYKSFAQFLCFYDWTMWPTAHNSHTAHAWFLSLITPILIVDTDFSCTSWLLLSSQVFSYRICLNWGILFLMGEKDSQRSLPLMFFFFTDF